MDLNSINWDRVTSIEMLCKCGHVNVFTVMSDGCELCGLKLEYQMNPMRKLEEFKQLIKKKDTNQKETAGVKKDKIK